MWAIGKCKSNIDCCWLTHHKTSRHDPRLSEHPQVKIDLKINVFGICAGVNETISNSVKLWKKWEIEKVNVANYWKQIYFVLLWDGQDDFKCSLVELIISRLGFHKNFEWRRKIFDCGQLRAVSHIAQLCPHPPLHLSPQNFHFLFCSFFCHFHFRQISVNLLLCCTFT